MKIVLGDFSAKVGREDIFKPTAGNEIIHEISNDIDLEEYILRQLKVSQSKVQYSRFILRQVKSSCECDMQPCGSINWLYNWWPLE
jgi:hypothetical protein